MSPSDPAKLNLGLCLAAIQPWGARTAGCFCSEGDVAPGKEDILENSTGWTLNSQANGSVVSLKSPEVSKVVHCFFLYVMICAPSMCVFADPEIKSVSGSSVFQWLLNCDMTGREKWFAVILQNYNKYKVSNEFWWWSEKTWRMAVVFAPKSCEFPFLFSTACFWEMDPAKYGSVFDSCNAQTFICV